MNDRMCILCKKRKNPAQLIKLTKIGTDVVINSKLKGRSCYIDHECIDLVKLEKGRFIQRSLRLKEIKKEIFEELKEIEIT